MDKNKKKPDSLWDKIVKSLGGDPGLLGEWNRIGGASSGMSWNDFKTITYVGGYSAGGTQANANLALKNGIIQLKNVQLMMGDLLGKKVPVPPGTGLIDFLNANGFPNMGEITVPASTFAHIRALHGWFSLSPGAKSKFFPHISGSAATMEAFMGAMVSGLSVVPGGYTMLSNHVTSFRVAVHFTSPVGMTGYYKEHLPVSTNFARFEFVVDDSGFEATMMSGYPIP